MTADTFSETTRYWLEKQDVLAEAERQFGQEWGHMLRLVNRRLAQKGWTCRLFGDPPYMIQTYRHHWPGAEAQVHYEAICSPALCRQGFVDFSLHMEQDLPDQEKVCQTARRLLVPYAPSVLAAGVTAMPDKPVHDILKTHLPLTETTGARVAEILENMMQAETFVDAALLAAGRHLLWHTDFLSQDPPVLTTNDWGQGNSEAGAWRPAATGGRYDTPCLEVRAVDEHNYRDQMDILKVGDWSIRFTELQNGEPFYAFASALCPAGMKLTLTLQTSREHGFYNAYEGTQTASPSPSWQLVRWEGTLAKPDDHDFTKEGLYAFLTVGPVTQDSRIDSIEFGQDRWRLGQR